MHLQLIKFYDGFKREKLGMTRCLRVTFSLKKSYRGLCSTGFLLTVLDLIMS